MRTTTEKHLEVMCEKYDAARERAFDLYLRTYNTDKVFKSRRLYFIISGKYEAYATALGMLREDKVIKAWHYLGAAYMEALEELRD